MHSKILLIVEDNEDDLELTLRALQRNSFTMQISKAANGAEALEQLEKEVPSLIFLDLKLPKLNGFDVLRHIRSSERTKTIPVVVLTTSSQEEDIRKSYELGATSYIRKPVNFDQFHDTMRQVISYWFSVNEPPPAPKAP